MPAEHLITTGFEAKTMRQCIENWLYTHDMQIRVDASLELRKRFAKVFPRPDWVKHRSSVP